MLPLWLLKKLLSEFGNSEWLPLLLWLRTLVTLTWLGHVHVSLSTGDRDWEHIQYVEEIQ